MSTVRRVRFLAAAFAALACLLQAGAIELAPAPRAANTSARVTDRALINEIKSHSEIMKNLEYLSDVIGPRLTGSKNLERANNWAADRMKAYGLTNVQLEPWEIPVGWERGTASMKLVEPDNGRTLTVASWGWSPSTRGKITGNVVIVNARTKTDLEKYRGKLKDAIVLMTPPTPVRPITDLTYPPPPGPVVAPSKKEVAPKEKPKTEAKKEGEQPGKSDQPARPPTIPAAFRNEMQEFFKAEGATCTVTDSGKPHGLLNMTGQWPADRAAAEARLPSLFMVHEHYAMLYRLASRTDERTRAEVEIHNTFIPGPVTVYNTVGEVRGFEKPDEYVVVGAHLDSWDLGSGTTDNGTGSCVVLEAARAIAALAKHGHPPRRTIRFVLFTGEEEGLHGSRQYVKRHEKEMARHSVALVHDTGTGKVTGFGLHGRESCLAILKPQLATLEEIEGWKSLEMRAMGGTDHLSFHAVGVPGFACLQDIDEYRLTHHSQSDTFDKAREPNLIQGCQVLAVTALRIANLPDMLPRQ
jgi:hypothetical protein